MHIPVNKPHMTGKELRYISQTRATGHLAGGEIFTKLGAGWLQEITSLASNAVR